MMWQIASPREGGVRVPMIARWPGVTSPNSVCDDCLIIEDYFTTILEIVGAAPEKLLEMWQMLRRYLKRVDAPVPSDAQTGDPIQIP